MFNFAAHYIFEINLTTRTTMTLILYILKVQILPSS